MLALDDVKPILVTEENKEEVLPGFSTFARPYVLAALDLGVEAEIFQPMPIAKLTYNGVSHFIVNASTPLNTHSSNQLTRSKWFTNLLWKNAGLPVPNSVRISREDGDNLEQHISSIEIDYPVVLKPARGTDSGEGVVLGIQNKDELVSVAHSSLQKYSRLLIEEYHLGLREYRIIILDGEVIAVGYKEPAYIVGDGIHTVEELIEAKNAQRQAVKELKLGPIVVNTLVHTWLSNQDLTLQSIPEKGQYVQLTTIGNLGAGGEMEEMTEKIHPDYKEIARKSVEVLSLQYGGIDILCTDITQPYKKGEAVLLEVNAHPGIPCHIYPQKGKPQQVAHAVVKAIFDL